MMTKAQTVAMFKVKYPDCPDSQASTLFDQAYRRLFAKCEIRKTIIDLPLVAQQREYTLNVGSFNISQAYYILGPESGNWRVLQWTNYDKLSSLDQGWVLETEGTIGGPIRVYVTGADDGNTAKGVIGFDPPPDTTTAGGYPIVRYYTNTWTDLDDGDTLPSNILNEDAVMYDMFVRWSTLKHPDHYQMNVALRDEATQATIAHVKSNALQNDTQFIPSQPRRRGI